jgi:streptomycin 6-kinase
VSDRAGEAADHPLLGRYLRAWRLDPDGEAFSTASSVLVPVLFGGLPAMLKVATVEEEAAGGRLMAWWNGRGSAPVYRHDETAVLLERAIGERSLVELSGTGPAGDDEAMRILCETATRLHAVPGRPRAGLTPLGGWFRALLGTLPDNPDPFHSRAAAIARGLLGDSTREGSETVVLHGDLHHGNVLDFGADGWRAIDPKALLGDPAFDYANMLCNPDAATALAPGRLECRLRVIESVAGIRRERMLRWTVAWGGLSSVWNVLDGRKPGHALDVGRAAERLLADS